MKLSLLLILPYFSFFYLKENYIQLEEQEFKDKFETLYQNLFPLKSSVYKMTTIFCIKRLIYALVTVYLGEHIVPNVYSYTLIPLFSIGFNLNNRPMNSRVLNFMENINEVIIYFSGYFLLVFTQWICDPR